MTVGQLLRQTDSRELSEWMAFFQLQAEPEEATAGPVLADTPEAQAALLKAELFKGK